MVKFSDSPENRMLQSTCCAICGAYACMLKRMPTSADHTTWTGLLDGGSNSVTDMVAMIRTSAEYRTIVGR